MLSELAPTGGNLWSLNGQLFELLEERESAAARCAVPGPDMDYALEELRAIDSAIGEFIANKVSEVTELRACVFALRDGVDINNRAAAEATARAVVLQNRLDGITALIKDCMEALGKKRFESAEGFFRLQGNGGVQPVTITNESLIPDELCNVTVTMKLSQWRPVERLFADAKVGRRAPSLSAIQKALSQPCPACCQMSSPAGCESCGGSGKESVPGARLEERGKSVVIR